jgi:amidohydrolase
MQIKQRLLELEPELIALRRDFHAHPELGFEEFRTQAIVLRYLKDLGIPAEAVAGTGVLGLLHGSTSGKTILLRADMDALPIQEENDLPYRSVQDGVMHACGHDGHTAMLMVAARVLWEYRDRMAGTVKLVFQPNEEDAGAERMIAGGVLKDPAVDAVFGCHLWNALATGTIDLRPGPVMAASHYFRLTIRGRGGHAGFAHQSVDPILTASQVIQAVQAIQTREVDALCPAVIMFTTMQAGANSTTVPETATLGGSIRFLYPGGEEIRSRFERIVRHTCQAHRADYDLTFEIGNDLLSNDEAMTRTARSAAVAVLGDERPVTDRVRTMAGEDFAAFANAVPAAFAFVGARDEGNHGPYPHHHPRFTVDENALIIGAELYVRTALRFLGLSNRMHG